MRIVDRNDFIPMEVIGETNHCYRVDNGKMVPRINAIEIIGKIRLAQDFCELQRGMIVDRLEDTHAHSEYYRVI